MWVYLQGYPQKNIYYHKLNLITNNSSFRRCSVNFFCYLINFRFLLLYSNLKSQRYRISNNKFSRICDQRFSLKYYKSGLRYGDRIYPSEFFERLGEHYINAGSASS